MESLPRGQALGLLVTLSLLGCSPPDGTGPGAPDGSGLGAPELAAADLAVGPDLAPLPLYTLSVDAGGGRVLSRPVGIDCPGACSAAFPEGTDVRLALSPDDWQSFPEWTGACTGTAACVVRMSGPQQVTVKISPRACTPGGFCWYEPLPRGDRLGPIWGSGMGDVWAVSVGGAVLRLDGQVRQVVSGTSATLTDIWGTGPRDIWAVGDNGTAIRYDGTAFRAVPTGTTTGLAAVHGSGPTNVWAVGESGIFRWNGTAWAAVPGPPGLGAATPLYDVWVGAADDVWVVGIDRLNKQGVYLHWDGGAWTVLRRGDWQFARQVCGTARNRVWFSSIEQAPSAGQSLLRWDGATIQPVAGVSDDKPLNISCRGAEVWGTRADGLLARFDGATWSTVAAGLPAGSWGPVSVGPQELWAHDAGGAAWRWDGAAAAPAVKEMAAFAGVTRELWARAEDDVWAAARYMSGLDSAQPLHWDGGSWSEVSTPLQVVNSVWSSGPDNLWVAGKGSVANAYHWDGARWSQPFYVPPTQRLWVSAPDLAWAFIGGTDLERCVGATCRLAAVDNFRILNLWGYGRDEVWYSTRHGGVLRWNGTRFVTVHQAMQWKLPDLYGLAGSGPRDVWAAGGGAIWHWDGAAWTTSHERPYQAGIMSLSTSGPGDVWAVGFSGLILRSDGARWTEVAGAGTRLYSVAVAGRDVWVAGTNGALLRHRRP